MLNPNSEGILDVIISLAGLFFRDVPLEITRTLLVEKIPEHMCKEDLVKRHFREAYPALTVTSVRLAYDAYASFSKVKGCK